MRVGDKAVRIAPLWNEQVQGKFALDHLLKVSDALGGPPLNVCVFDACLVLAYALEHVYDGCTSTYTLQR